ncbi:hypothetical protein [Salinibacter virus M31CR41-3]|nr:hypothetical protein [Salinibacter virus M31CR41-3]
MAKEVLNIDISDVEQMVQSLHEAEETANRTGDSVRELTNDFETAVAEIRRMEETLNDIRTSLNQMSPDTDGYEELKQEARDFESAIADAKAGLNATADEMQEVANDSDRTASELEVAAGQYKDMARWGNRIKNRTKETASQADKLAHSNANARQSAMALGNILSDAPHGMMAISNNVGELVEGFQNINTSSKGIMGYMKAMVGPALLGGLLTGVFTLASRWDKVRDSIESATMALQGYSDAQIALNEAVNKGVEKRLTKKENLKKLTEDQQELLLQTLKTRRDSLEEQQKGTAGDPSAYATSGENPTPDIMQTKSLSSELEDMLKTLNTMDKKTSRVKKEVRTLLSQAGTPEGEIGDIIQRLFGDEDGEETFDAKDVREFRREVERMRIKMATQGAEQKMALKQQEIQAEQQAELKKARKMFGPNSEQFRLVKSFYKRKQMLAEQQIKAELEAQEVAQRKENRMAQISVRRNKAQAMNARTLPIPGRGIGSNVQQVRNQIARKRTQRGFAAEKRNAQIQAVQERRRDMVMRMFGTPGGPTNEQSRQMQSLNRQYSKLLAKRRSARAKHNREMKKLRQQENQAQFRQTQKKMGAISQMTSNVQQAFSSLTGVIRAGVQQRIRQYRREGMSQEKARKKAVAESRAKFNQMKKIQIAASVANTIAAGVKNFHGTIEKMGGGPLAYGVAISQMAATLASGYAQVRKLQQTKIGGGVPGQGTGGGGGSLSSSFSQLDSRTRNERVRNFVQETASDQVRSDAESDTAKAIREEEAKTREKLDESRAIGDEESFDSNQRAEDYRNKAVS